MNNFRYEQSQDGSKVRLVILIGEVQIPTTIKDWCTEYEMDAFLSTLCVNFDAFKENLKEIK